MSQVFNIDGNSLKWSPLGSFSKARFVYFSHNNLNITFPTIVGSVDVRSEYVELVENHIKGSWPSMRADNLRQLFLDSNPLT